MSDDDFRRAVERHGCPECGALPLTGAYVCEHGVAPPIEITLTATTVIKDPELYRRLLCGE